MNKHLFWGVIVYLIALTIVVGAVIISNTDFVIRIEMDNNTLQAIQSINYTEVTRVNG